MVGSITRGPVTYVRRVWDYRYFWMSLVKADLQRRYRRSFLGMGWSLLTPILMTLVLSAVYSKILNMPLEEYGPLLMTGFAFWGFFSGSVLGGCSCFHAAGSYIRQEPAPLAIYSLRTVLGLGFHGMIAMVLAIGMAAIFGGVRSLPAMLTLIPTFMMLLVMAWCTTTLVGLFSVYFPDVQYLCDVLLQVLFFLTPIIYPAKMLIGKGGLVSLLAYNPLAMILDMIRVPILESDFPPQHLVFKLGAFLIVLIAITSLALSKMEKKLIFEL